MWQDVCTSTCCSLHAVLSQHDVQPPLGTAIRGLSSVLQFGACMLAACKSDQSCTHSTQQACQSLTRCMYTQTLPEGSSAVVDDNGLQVWP